MYWCPMPPFQDTVSPSTVKSKVRVSQIATSPRQISSVMSFEYLDQGISQDQCVCDGSVTLSVRVRRRLQRQPWVATESHVRMPGRATAGQFLLDPRIRCRFNLQTVCVFASSTCNPGLHGLWWLNRS